MQKQHLAVFLTTLAILNQVPSYADEPSLGARISGFLASILPPANAPSPAPVEERGSSSGFRFPSFELPSFELPSLSAPAVSTPTPTPTPPRAGSVGWTAGTHGNLRVSSTTTNNSSIQVEGTVSRDFVNLLVITKNTDLGEKAPVSKEMFAVTSLSFSSKVYFREGPGSYELKIYGCLKDAQSCESIEEITIENSDRRDMSFLLPSSEVQNDASEIYELAQKITEGANSPMEKSRAIHDWITGAIAYDTEGYFTGSYLNKAADALSTLQIKVSVCKGYSTLTAALHRAVGIRTKVVIGTADPINTGSTGGRVTTERCNHAWNEAYVDGKWILMDNTWDAGYVDFVSQKFSFSPGYEYFNASPSQFSVRHEKCYDSKI